MRASRPRLPKALDPFLETGKRVAQLADAARVPGLLLATHEESHFFGEEIRRRRGKALRRVELPCRKTARRAGDAVRRDVADQARELFLHVPAQMARERRHLLGE